MEGYWFKKKSTDWWMTPVSSGGRWCWFWYLTIVSTPPTAVYFLGLKPDALILFLLVGHVTLFTTTFYIAARLHCYVEEPSKDQH